MRAREGGVDPREFLVGEVQIAGAGILLDMIKICGLGDREHRRPAREKGQRYLAWRRIARGGDLGQHPPAGCMRAGKAAVSERAIRDNSNAVLLAPRNHRRFDRALEQMIEHLITGEMPFAGDRQNLVEVADVEIADTPAEDFALLAQLLERGDRLGQRVGTAPM